MNIIQAQNPFFEKYSTPHGTIPFEKIKTEHYEPAIREGINRQMRRLMLSPIIRKRLHSPTRSLLTRNPANC